METRYPEVNAGGIYERSESAEGGNNERGRNGIGAKEATAILATGRYGGESDMARPANVRAKSMDRKMTRKAYGR